MTEGEKVTSEATVEPPILAVPPPKKVAIVGFSAHRVDAPYKDEAWEIWGLNDLYEQIPRYSRWFEMHSWAHTLEYQTRKAEVKGSKPYLQGLSELKCDVWMQETHPEIPNSKRYPIEAVKEKYGDYFTNSISYMIAMAIDEKYDEIGVYGVDMAQDTEYSHQRPSCEYIIGWARGSGIKVTLAKTSDLLKIHFMYGYEDALRTSWEARVDEIEKGVTDRKRQSEIQQQQARDAALQYAGALDAIRTLKRVHV